MRRRHKRRNVFIGLTLNSFVALVSIVGLMFVFAKSFGELAIQAIQIMAVMLCIPVGTLIVGVCGWLWTERSDW
jgi:hypothetical protein